MKKTDGRALSHATLEEFRIRAVQRVLAGESPEAVVAALGFSRSQIYVWLRAYREGGIEALRARPVPGRPRKLSESQLRQLRATILGKNPAQLRFPYALWTLAIIRQLIADRFRVALTEVQIGRILKAMGITPQRPLWRAWQQDPKRVEKWMREEYPAIRAEAQRAGAEIYFGDEAGLRSDHHAGTTWGARGVTPVVKATGARHSLNMISAISPRGTLRFMVHQGTCNAERFIRFLRRLLKGAKRPVFLIVDGHSAHRSALTRAFVAGTRGKLRLFALPPYSPELNADELVWNHAKARIGRKTPDGAAGLRRAAIGSLRSIQKQPDLVRSFFRHPETSYAA